MQQLVADWRAEADVLSDSGDGTRLLKAEAKGLKRAAGQTEAVLKKFLDYHERTTR